MARYRYLCPLRWGDMDAYGHVNNVLFLRYLEQARIGMFHAAAPDDGGGLVDTGILVARHEIDYLRPLHYRQHPVAIDVWVTDIAAASFEVCYEVLDPAEPHATAVGADGPAGAADAGQPGPAADIVYARAESTMVVFDFSRDAPRRLHPDELARLRPWEEAPVALKRRSRPSPRQG